MLVNFSVFYGCLYYFANISKLYFKIILVKQFKDVSISEDERQRMLESDDFFDFFTRNTRILEKALEQDDIFFEYGASDTNKEWGYFDKFYHK